MKQYFGMSQTGNLKEAAQGVHAPGLLILMSNADQFEAHVTELESLFPVSYTHLTLPTKLEV